MHKKREATLTQGPVGRTLFGLAGPMTIGFVSAMSFQLADAYFVASMGPRELAALSFTFPVAMLFGSIAVGLGMGTASAIARAIGSGDEKRVRRLATDSLLMALAIALSFAAAGLATIGPLFRALGAEPDLIPLIREYMEVWYVGIVFLIIPMVGNNALRGAGDTKTPSFIMVIATGVNIALDPLLIFGLWGFPEMGLRGAALATVFARALGLAMSLLILRFRERMVEFALPSAACFWASCKTVLHVGAPAAATNVLWPLSMVVATRVVSGYGPEAVAAMGTGNRIEGFSIIVLMALGASLAPFAGQNWGAGLRGRVREAQNLSNRFALAWGAGCVALYWFAADWVAGLFGDDPEVARILALYLRIASLGFAFRGVCHLTASSFNAIGKPGRAAALNFARTFVLYAPLALLGSRLFGLAGVFSGMALANFLSGMAAFAMLRRACGEDADSEPAALEALEESGGFEDELEAEAVGGIVAE